MPPIAVVSKDSYLMTKDIDLDQRTSAPVIDGFVNRCVGAAFEALRGPTSVFTQVQQEHLSFVLKSMRPTHEAIRELLRSENRSPISVNAMPLARLQLETLYAVCLVLDQPQYLGVYLKHCWKQIYVRHLLMLAECKNLPPIMAELDKQLTALEGLRQLAGVTDEEKATIRSEQLGETLPHGMTGASIPQFPTPGAVIRAVSDSDRKKMLTRLYFEYQFLCSFVHFSPHPRTFMGFFDEREPFGRMFTTGELENMFQKEIAGPAIWIDFLSIVQSATELVSLYPASVELRKAVADAWVPLSEKTIIGRAVWEFRAKKLLGII